MKRSVRIFAVVSALGVVAAACSKKPPATTPEPTGGGITTSTPTTPTTTPTSNTGGGNTGGSTDAETRRLTLVLEQMVFFDYDEATIRTDAQQALAAKVPVLQASPTVRIRIEGHADERGSVEYNLALGMRRAQAVKEYLVGFGLDPSRFETNSFGEDRPRTPGATETAWSENRRAEFRIAGGTIIVR